MGRNKEGPRMEGYLRKEDRSKKQGEETRDRRLGKPPSSLWENLKGLLEKGSVGGRKGGMGEE